jgi:hypothetical protein
MAFDDPRSGDILERKCRKCGKRDTMTVEEFCALPDDDKKHCTQCQGEEPCAQCENPMLKGVHTCEKAPRSIRARIRAEVAEEIAKELESHVNDLDSPDTYCVGFDKGLQRAAEVARRIGNNQTPWGKR